MNPFDFLKSINRKTGNIIDREPETEKYYVPFIINKALSMFPDTVLCANSMNKLYNLPKKMQYDYYYGCIKKKDRFSKWIKPEENPIIDMISQYYKVNKNRAKEYLSFMSEEDIEFLNKLTNIGGVSK